MTVKKFSIKKFVLSKQYYLFTALMMLIIFNILLLVSFYKYNNFKLERFQNYELEAKQISKALNESFGYVDVFFRSLNDKIVQIKQNDSKMISDILSSKAAIIGEKDDVLRVLFDFAATDGNISFEKDKTLPNKRALKREASKRSLLIKARQQPQVLHLADPTYRGDNEYALPAVYGIKDKNDNYFGTLSILFNLNKIQQRIHSFLSDINTHYVVLNENGKLIAQSDGYSDNQDLNHLVSVIEDRNEHNKNVSLMEKPVSYGDASYVYNYDYEPYGYNILIGEDKFILKKQLLRLMWPQIMIFFGSGAFFLFIYYCCNMKSNHPIIVGYKRSKAATINGYYRFIKLCKKRAKETKNSYISFKRKLKTKKRQVIYNIVSYFKACKKRASDTKAAINKMIKLCQAKKRQIIKAIIKFRLAVIAKEKAFSANLRKKRILLAQKIIAALSKISLVAIFDKLVRVIELAYKKLATLKTVKRQPEFFDSLLTEIVTKEEVIKEEEKALEDVLELTIPFTYNNYNNTYHDEPKIEEKAAITFSDLKKKKTNILLIDDEESCLLSMKIFLYISKYNLITAQGGQAGLDFLFSNPDKVDLIMLDLMMTDKYGLNVLAEMREQPGFKNIPVIIQTGSIDFKEMEKAEELGVMHYLKKPYQKDIILKTLDEVLAESTNETSRLLCD